MKTSEIIGYGLALAIAAGAIWTIASGVFGFRKVEPPVVKSQLFNPNLEAELRPLIQEARSAYEREQQDFGAGKVRKEMWISAEELTIAQGERVVFWNQEGNRFGLGQEYLDDRFQPTNLDEPLVIFLFGPKSEIRGKTYEDGTQGFVSFRDAKIIKWPELLYSFEKYPTNSLPGSKLWSHERTELRPPESPEFIARHVRLHAIDEPYTVVQARAAKERRQQEAKAVEEERRELAAIEKREREREAKEKEERDRKRHFQLTQEAFNFKARRQWREAEATLELLIEEFPNDPNTRFDKMKLEQVRSEIRRSEQQQEESAED